MNNNDKKNKMQTSLLMGNNIKPITQHQHDTSNLVDKNDNSSSNPHSIIYSNISQANNNPNNYQYVSPQFQQHQQNYESQSTILSIPQSDAPVMNQPQYALYSSGGEDQKMLICKSQLVSFAQCFAQEKIQLENTVQGLKGKVSQLEKQCRKLQEQNVRLKSQIQLKPQQKQQQQSPTNKSPSSHLQQQLLQLKSKLKQQFEKRIQAQKQYHNQKAISFQLNKKIQFLSQKLVYQQQQLNRCQNLLKIKQDIIQNFQWERTIVMTARNNNGNNNSNNNDQNGKHNSNSINRSKQHHQQQQQQQSPSYDEQNSPLSKKAFLNNRNKNIHSNSNSSQNKQSIPNIAINQNNYNQTLNLSEINLLNNNNSGNNSNCNNGNKLSSTEIIKKPTTKYVINKKTNIIDHRNHLYNEHKLSDSKKKLNVSLKKNSLNNSLQFSTNKLSKKNNTNNTQQVSPQKKQRSLKPKSIMLKRHTSTHSQQITDQSLFFNKQKQKQFQAYYMRIITELEKENQRLESQLIKVTQHSTSRFNDPSVIIDGQSLQRVNVQNNNSNKCDYAQLQRRYSMMKQKCQLLQNQLQKTVTKYLSLQQHNQQLQRQVIELKNTIKSLKHERVDLQDRRFNKQQQPLSRPSLGLADLVTPQFRQNKWNNNFFAKSKNDQNHNHTQKLFQNISLHEKGYQPRKNTFLDTFQKQKPPQNQHESCFIDNNSNNKVSSNSLFNIQIDDKAASNVFKGSIQDVSEIICRNDQQQVMEETF